MKFFSLLLVMTLPVAAASRATLDALEEVPRWNQIALDASGLDHTPTGVGMPHIFGEQLGPCRAARAMAIVHIAMFDTANGAGRKYESFTGLRGPASGTTLKVAISQAAHDTLVALFPSQWVQFDAFLTEDLETIRSRAAKRRGARIGQRIAAKILDLRAHDGSDHPEIPINVPGLCYVTSDQPGHWRQDPISGSSVALGARWSECLPFVMKSNAQCRVPPPPALDSAEYAAAYLEAQYFGGDGIHTPTWRTEEQTEIGTFWAYDGTPSLCAPPRMYNQVALTIARQQHSSGVELARLLALVNVAMADAGMAVWDSKYHYDFWRPVTGIRESDEGTGVTGEGDGNDDTVGDENFYPLGAPASNLSGPNFTPPFPAYPSGHAGFGGALFQTLRRFYQTDGIAFTFVSDEFNGVTVDNQGYPRPFRPRSFNSLSQAEEENGQSRIYLGIHWSFDKTQGIAQGNQVADYVFDHAFRSRRR